MVALVIFCHSYFPSSFPNSFLSFPRRALPKPLAKEERRESSKKQGFKNNARSSYGLSRRILSLRRMRRIGHMPLLKMFWVYILKSNKFDKTYVGIPDNIEKRLKEHNEGHSSYTRKYRPWSLIYSEELENRKDARIREKWYKSYAGRKAIKNIINNKLLPDRLMVGHTPLERGILVRIQVRQPS